MIDGNWIHGIKAPKMTLGITVDGVAVTNEFIRDNHFKKGITTPFNVINSGSPSRGTPPGTFS